VSQSIQLLVSEKLKVGLCSVYDHQRFASMRVSQMTGNIGMYFFRLLARSEKNKEKKEISMHLLLTDFAPTYFNPFAILWETAGSKK
jgi:hypothetical protein